MREQHSPDEGRVRVCKACGSRPAVLPQGGTSLCERCSRLLELPDVAGLVDDDGAGVRHGFENLDGRPEG